MTTGKRSRYERYGVGLAIGLALITLAATQPRTAERAHRCESDATRALEALALPANSLSSLHIVTVLRNPKFSAVLEYQAWANPRRCNGSVVVRMTPTCRVMESYTRGDCRIEGVPHF